MLVPAAAAFAAISLSATAPAASAHEPTTYEATLNAINGSGASGTFWLSLHGNQATVTEKVSGLAATFMNAPYPHVQHIHGGAMGMCPDPSADTSGDGVISTTEGAPHYGGILTTLSKTGDTTPAAGTDVTIAPSGSSYTYKRTITLSADTVKALQSGTAVIVVHGLDPAKIPAAARTEKSDLVPSLPLAATSPALCGKVNVSQMSKMPSGGVQTGGGGTSGGQDTGMLYGGAGLLVGAGALLTVRRRFAKQS
ncbi:hypothetical protein GCM10027579_14380 [Calidifontibacter terrae]